MLYDAIGPGYRNLRRPDPRIVGQIHQEIGSAGKILNVGAGTGSYEPAGREVVALEPSWAMISQRGRGHAPVVRARAERLPFMDNAFEVALAILTVHHWSDIESGLAEMRRVARRRVVLFTWIGFVEPFWLLDYLPRIKEVEEPLFPSLERISAGLKGPIRVVPVPIAHDCIDGFLCAYWRRPRCYLQDDVRRAISAFARISGLAEGLDNLRGDLDSGRWRQKYREIVNRENMDHGYRIVVCDLGAD